jgi:hypothetical protein
LQKELKDKRFTYDYDGKLLNTKGVNPEKLAPAHVPVG